MKGLDEILEGFGDMSDASCMIRRGIRLCTPSTEDAENTLNAMDELADKLEALEKEYSQYFTTLERANDR